MQNVMKWLMTIDLTLLFGLYSCRKGDGTTTLKLAHSLDLSHPVHKGMV